MYSIEFLYNKSLKMKINYINNLDNIKHKIPYNSIILSDCIEAMKHIESNSIDAIICDLPYQVTSCKWDILIPFEDLWNCYDRVIKDNGAIVLFGREPFTSYLIISNVKRYRQKLTWLKTRPTNVMNAKKQFMNWTEDIVIFYKSLPTFNPQMRTDGAFTGSKIQRLNTDRSKGVFGKTGEKKDYIHESNNGLFYPKTVLEFSNVNQHKNIHPTQKPVELIEYLIKTYSNEGDLILDNTAGSMTTAIAAINTNRNFICIEKDEKFFQLGIERVEQHLEIKHNKS